MHDQFPEQTGIDLNRAGTPLLEIVSEPDMRSAKGKPWPMRARFTPGALPRDLRRQHAGRFFPLRCQRVGAAPGRRANWAPAELKNINSFRFLERAINHEIERQIDLIEDGGSVVQETRLYDAERDETRSMRSKEEANDYRYFPDPDLLPVSDQRSRYRRDPRGAAGIAGAEKAALHR